MRRELFVDITPSSRRMKLENKEKESSIRKLSVVSFNRNANTGDVIGTVTQEDNVILKLKIVDDSGQPVNPNGETIKLYINRSDETLYEQDNDITIFEDGIVQIVCRNTAFNVIGNQTCHLELTNSEGTSITSPFIIEVEKSPIGKEVLNNTNEVRALEDLKNTTDKFKKELDMFLAAGNNEDTRIKSEEVRGRSEEARNRNETSRSNAEALRIEKEATRVNQEALREEKEQERIAAEKIREEKITEFGSQVTENTNQIDTIFTDGFIDLYDLKNSQEGGLNHDGSDAEAEGFSRSEYIPINNNKSGSGCTIKIVESSGLLKDVFGFLYKEKNGNGIKVQPQYINDEFIINVNGDYKYFRMNDISATQGDFRKSLHIYVNGKMNSDILRKYDIDKRFFLNDDIEFINGEKFEIYDGSNINGGLNQDGSDATTEGYSRSEYLKVIPNSTLTLRDSNLRLTTPFVFFYISKNDKTGSKLIDYTTSEPSTFTFNVPENCNYIRLLTKSATAGDYSEGLSITSNIPISSGIDDIVLKKIKLSDVFIKKTDGGSNNSGISTGKLPRPANGVVNFSIKLNVNQQNFNNTLTAQDTYQEMEDWGILLLPENYNENGKPVRLVINCHGAGTYITNSTTSLASPVSYLVKGLGYAVLDMNGIPSVLSKNSGLHFGAPFALQSYIKGYHYVMEKYNLKSDGCFVTGTSMGGLTSFMLVQSGSIPVIAQAGFCPCLDHFKQAYCNPWSNGERQRSDIARFFGFDNYENFNNWTNETYPSQAEIDYYKQNIDKVIGYNPIMKYTQNWNEIKPYNYPSTNTESEKNEYMKLVKYHPVPLKIWHNDDDGTVLQRYSEYLVNAIKSNGGLAYLRRFPSGGHNAWDNGETVNTIDYNGNQITTKVSGYELGLWFKRFDI